MRKTKWVMDEYFIRNNVLLWNVADIFSDLKIECHIAEYDSYDYGPYEDGDNVVLYGTIKYIKNCKKAYSPGAYGYTPNRQCNVYMSNVPNAWFLNSDHIMLTWDSLKQRHGSIYALLETDTIFIRPVSGDKTFTGQEIKRIDFPFEANSLDQISSVTNETIIMIAPSKRQEIVGEFRFIIGAGEVIAGSEYRWDDKLDIRRDWPAECETMASRVARLPWQLDTVYTCDVALMSNGEPKIVELNGFASAGWYACDQRAIIKRVTEIAEAEHEGKL